MRDRRQPLLRPPRQRPAYFPPGDGYRPPRDPLLEVARLAQVTRELAVAHPELVVVGSGLTYAQDHVGALAEGLVGEGWMHVAGLGRMMLSDPDLPARLLRGEPVDRRLVCRTFSDCTTAPRNGMVSGCYPLDPAYRDRPERVELARVKRRLRAAGTAGEVVDEDVDVDDTADGHGTQEDHR